MKEHILEMMRGPGTARMIVQPMMAVLFGIVHGMRDRKAGHPPFVAGAMRAHEGRLRRLADGLRGVAVPVTIALIASVAFQYVVRAHVRLGYAVLYAFLAVVIPYFAARGITNRVAQLTPAKKTRPPLRPSRDRPA
jgi:hypothetical protein